MERNLNSIILLTLSLFVLTSSFQFSQSVNSGTISGKIFDSISGEGLPGVNVYFSNTSIGTASERNGNYKISRILDGTYSIVVSLIGYKPIIQKVEIQNGSNLQKNFYLESRPIEMNTITVSEHSDEYSAYLRDLYNFRNIFKKYFLGQTDFSKECVIENEDDIIFNKISDVYIEAKCTKPIIIINKALGYKIECQLLHFLCNDTRKESNCEFYPKFSELIPENEIQKERWNENRKIAYISSLRRFLLSVMKQKAVSDKYGLYLAQRTYNIKKVPISKMMYGKENIIQFDSTSRSFLLSFKGFLYVNNFITKEPSWIFLPFGNAGLGRDGYPINPMSIQVFDTFARQGLANLLPIENSILEYEEP